MTTQVGTLAKHREGRKRGEAGGDVHDDAARKVVDAPSRHVPVRAPHHVAERAVDEEEPDRNEGEVRSHT